jgi:hypothetical protein
MQGGYTFQALGTAATCNNLCDPECQSLQDTPDGLTVPADLLADVTGLTLPVGGGGGTCNNLVVSPSSPTVTVTAIATDGSVTATPANIDFEAMCSGGVPAAPTWSLDTYDRAVIDTSGIVTVYSGIAGTVTVTASSATDSATQPVNVVVAIGSLNPAGTTTDPMTTLYPYRNTVFPLDLKAPLVQYSDGGQVATAVQMALRYPVGSTSPTFLYVDPTNYATDPHCTTSSDPTNPCLNASVPAWQIPQQIWTAFGRTAAGDATGGEIVIRRRKGATIYAEKTIPVKFASQSLPGTVYYTQYRRNFNASPTKCTGTQSSCTYKCKTYSGATCTSYGTAASDYKHGQTCPVGNVSKPISSSNSSMTRAIDLATTAASNSNPYNPTNSGSIVTGCPVCHSVSANGNVFVSSNLSWQAQSSGTTRGIGTIGISGSGLPSFTGIAQSPTYTGLSESGASASGGDPYNNYERNNENSRGFAYSGISPDGALVLQGATFWGNTIDQPSTNNLQDATLQGITGELKPYFFVKTAKPGLGVQFAPTGALPTNTRSGNVLTATSNGALSIDGVAMGTNYSVLVWSEATAANNGVYYVSNAGSGSSKWTLTRRSDADGTACSTCATEITPGMDVRVSDGNTNRDKIFYISSPSSGSITVNSTAITFTKYTGSPIVLGSGHLDVDYATTAALSPAPTQAGNVLTASSLGPLVVDGTTLGIGDRVLVKDQASQQQNGVYSLTTLGTGGGSTPISVNYATTAALPSSTLSGNVLTATGNGALVVDGVTLTAGNGVLVKDEAQPARNGAYTLTTQGAAGGSTTLGPVKYATTGPIPAHTRTGHVLTSTVRGALSVDSVTLALNDSVLLKNEGTAAENGVYTLTTLGTGGSTALASVQYATQAALPAHSQAANVLTGSVNSALVVDGTTLVSGDSVLVRSEGATSSKHGVYTLTAQGQSGGGTPLASGAVKVATQAALPAHSAAAGVLTATVDGALVVDGVTLSTGESVLVMDEGATSSKHGVYTLTTVGTGSSTALAAAQYATTATLAPNTAVGTTVLRGNTGGAFGAIDGHTFVAGESLLVKDETTPAKNGVYTLTTLGGGTTTAPFTPGVAAATTGALPSHAQAGNVLTASANGTLPTIDGVTLSVGSALLVWNETSAQRNGIYTVTSLGSWGSKWVLTRRADANTTGELAANKQVSVTGGTTHGGRAFYVSTAPTTINTTTVGFTIATWELTRRSDANVTGEIFTGLQVPVTGGTANGAKTFYVTTSGTITLGTTGIAFAQSTRWALTRRSDANQAAELVPGAQVAVTNGTDAGATYYISTPSSGVPVLETTAFAWSRTQPWVLTRRTDADVTGELTVGLQVPVSAGTSAGQSFYISTPSSGAITLNTTPMAFTQSAYWQLTRRDDSRDPGELAPGLQVPITLGTSAGFTFYISTPSSGTITTNTTSIAFSQALQWVLTRRTDADSGAELVGSQASVTAGSTNSGKTYYVSAPTSTGAFTLNSSPITYAVGTNWVLTRTSDANSTGELTPGQEVSVASGSVNAGTVHYISSPTSGSITLNTTAIAYARAGGLPAMMVPVFSPDGQKVAYVNADADTIGGATATGWRRGLSMFNVDLSTYPPIVSNRQRLLNTWNSSTAGDPFKWPFFESDSRSLVYVRGEASEFCSAADSGHSITVNSNIRRACFEGSYGSMSPTTRGYFDGKLYSLDTENPSSTNHELVTLNDANQDGDSSDLTDAMSYQPTVLPFSRGGYRWVIFTSQREFGNQLNEKSAAGVATDFSCTAATLWVGALTDETADNSDRSQPAFVLPGQNLAALTANDHYINERGYLVPSPCKEEGDSCGQSDECCGADATPATAACRAPAGWTPLDGAPAKTCEALSAGCHQVGESCDTSADCCSGSPCTNFACTDPGGFASATFTREYVAECPAGYHPNWQLFNYHLTTPSDTSLEFSAQTAQDLGDLDAAPVVDLGSSTNTVISPTTPEFIDVGGELEAAGQSRHLTNLRIMVTLVASSDAASAPTLHDWEQRYTCEAAE